MAVPWGLVVFLLGLAFGYMQPGRQDKSELFKKGVLLGLIVAIVVAVLGWLFEANPLGLRERSFLGIILSFVLLSILFVVGVWIGDWLEDRRERRRALPRA